MQDPSSNQQLQATRSVSEAYFNFESQLEDYTEKELRQLADNLNYLGTHFDPFNPLEGQSKKVEKIIKKLELNDAISNPFTFTNTLLAIIDQVEQEIKRRIYK